MTFKILKSLTKINKYPCKKPWNMKDKIICCKEGFWNIYTSTASTWNFQVYILLSRMCNLWTVIYFFYFDRHQLPLIYIYLYNLFFLIKLLLPPEKHNTKRNKTGFILFSYDTPPLISNVKKLNKFLISFLHYVLLRQSKTLNKI